jgi:hypothetical protein
MWMLRFAQQDGGQETHPVCWRRRFSPSTKLILYGVFKKSLHTSYYNYSGHRHTVGLGVIQGNIKGIKFCGVFIFGRVFFFKRPGITCRIQPYVSKDNGATARGALEDIPS